jgi:CheY-like chemotaxis protein
MTGVLIVDQSQANRVLCRGVLESLGYLVFEAATTKEAIEQLNLRPIDLIFADFETDGSKLLSQVRTSSHQTALPVLFMCCPGVVPSMKVISRDSFEGYVVKPVTKLRLQDTLSELFPESRRLIRTNVASGT